MVLGGDNSAYREPFQSFVTEYLKTGKGMIIVVITTINKFETVFPKILRCAMGILVLEPVTCHVEDQPTASPPASCQLGFLTLSRLFKIICFMHLFYGPRCKLLFLFLLLLSFKQRMSAASSSKCYFQV